MTKAAREAALVTVHLKHYATGQHSLLWAFIEMNEITYMEAERGWSITQALVAAAPDDKALGYIAAGPLEEILEMHGPEIIDRVEDLAKKDPKFLKALSLVACFETPCLRRLAAFSSRPIQNAENS